MQCEDARLAVMVDPGETIPATAEQHVSTCSGCRAHMSDLRELRARLVDVPPVPRAALAAARRRVRRRRRLHVAAPAVAFVVAFVVAVASLWTYRESVEPRSSVVASTVERLGARQLALDAFAVELRITEHGVHPDVPVRTYEGTVVVSGPERAHVVINDTTTYPTDAWTANDVEVRVDGGASMVRATVGCAVRLLPQCVVGPTTEITSGRVPFADDAALAEVAVPLDAVAGSGGTLTPAGEGVMTASARVAQVSELLDVLVGHGTWRAVYPADLVELRFHGDSLRFTGFTITALASETRASWAVANGYDDAPGATVLEVEMQPLPEPPEPVEVPPVEGRDSGYIDHDPATLDGLMGYRPHRTGTLGPVRIESWTKGLRQLRITTVPAAPGFGVPHGLVSPVEMGDGVAYLDPAGRRLLALTPSGDVVEIAGNSSIDELLAAAVARGVAGVRVPASWPESRALAAGELARRHPRLVSTELGAPALVEEGTTLRASWWLGGELVVELTAREGDVLPPPFGAGVVGVVVEGLDSARYSPSLDRMEWLASGRVWVLEGAGLDLTALASVASEIAG